MARKRLHSHVVVPNEGFDAYFRCYVSECDQHRGHWVIELDDGVVEERMKVAEFEMDIADGLAARKHA